MQDGLSYSARIPDHDDQIRLARLFGYRLLPDLRCKADFIMNLRSREFIEQTLHDMLDVPLTHRCLVRNDDSG